MKAKFDELVEIMKTLRAKCPWDMEQTHDSIKQNSVEEAYELVDAIEAKDDARIKEELGDLLIQVLFHSQIASERNAFNIDDVISSLKQKLIDRHPHVFGIVDAKHKHEVLRNWEERKAREGKGMKGIPNHMPALLQAYMVADRLSRVRKLPEKKIVVEALYEGLRAAEGGDMDAIGDLLWNAAVLAKINGVEPEMLLRKKVLGEKKAQ